MQWTTDTTYVLGAGVGSSYALAVSNTTVIMIPQGVRGMLLVFVAPQRPPSCTIDFPSPHVRPNARVHARAPLTSRGMLRRENKARRVILGSTRRGPVYVALCALTPTRTPPLPFFSAAGHNSDGKVQRRHSAAGEGRRSFLLSGPPFSSFFRSRDCSLEVQRGHSAAGEGRSSFFPSRPSFLISLEAWRPSLSARLSPSAPFSAASF